MPRYQQLYERSKLFSVPNLKDRGWTAAAVKRFLPEPDDTRPNPFHKTGPEMGFYLISRVKQIERTKAWCNWAPQSAKRKQSAAQAVATKEEKLQEYVDSIEITVPVMDVETLTAKAVAHYNSWWAGTEKHAQLTTTNSFWLTYPSIICVIN